jgi:hypothetical protein
MKSKEKEGWEDRFDKLFYLDNKIPKAFIRQLIKKARAEGIEEGINEGIDLADRNYKKNIIPAVKAEAVKETVEKIEKSGVRGILGKDGITIFKKDWIKLKKSLIFNPQSNTVTTTSSTNYKFKRKGKK